MEEETRQEESLDEGQEIHIDSYGQYNLNHIDETIEEVDGFQVRAVVLNRSNRRFVPDTGEVWSLSDGSSEYNVLFPRTENLQIKDGYLVNTGSSNITGVVLDSNGIDLGDYFDYTITILPLYSSSSQNTAYRYGAHSYLTHYTTNGSSNLVTTVSYNDFSVLSKPFGFSFSASDMIIIGLLLLSVFVSILGGLLRR